MTLDPIGLEGGINPFAYANNPVNFIDPLGLFESYWFLKWVPGQHLFDQGMTALENRQYGWAATYFAGMLGEQVLTTLTFGQGTAARGAATACEARVASRSISFAPGLGRSAFATDRLQHAARHLIDAGILPKWSKSTGELFVEIGSQIVENPSATFDYVLRAGQAVKGFVGQVNGATVVIFLFSAGPNAGKVATAVVPSANQIIQWGIR